MMRAQPRRIPLHARFNSSSLITLAVQLTKAVDIAYPPNQCTRAGAAWWIDTPVKWIDAPFEWIDAPVNGAHNVCSHS